MEGEKKGPDGERGRQGGGRKEGSRWREERREGKGWGRRDQGRGGGADHIMCVFVGGGAIQVRLSDGSRGQVRTLPQALALIKAFDQ